MPHYASLDAASDTSLPRHERGRAVFNYRCYFCHGYSGDANTLAATYLDPKPRNFQKTSAKDLSRAKMLETVRFGKPDTAMKGFENFMSREEIELVVDFIRQEFIIDKAANTRYHTKENGWDNHERYAKAFPFANGEIPIDTPSKDLSKEQREGLRLFLSSCITCHDRAKVWYEGQMWTPRPVSYPRNGYSHQEARPDAVSQASVFGKHDIKPVFENLTASQQLGEQLFQDNCAFCHGADGQGKNWIGSFLEPPPRNLTSEREMLGMTRNRLRIAIMEGLPDSKMPAWKSVLKPAEVEALIDYISRAFHPLEPS